MKHVNRRMDTASPAYIRFVHIVKRAHETRISKYKKTSAVIIHE
jgi:hypothetical protein